MAERTQLNVNISPELLKSLKHNAIKSGMTLANYVTEIIKCYISNEDLIEEEEQNNSNRVSARIESIENQLDSVINQLNMLNNAKKTYDIKANQEIAGFTKQGSITFGKAVSKLFEDECKKRNLNTQEAVIELTPLIQSTFNIKYWGPLIEMFSENKILTTPDLLYEVYEAHDGKCPMYDLFYKWCGKEPSIIEDKFLEAIIH